MTVWPQSDAFRYRRAKPRAELQVSAHERRRAHVDYERIAVSRKTESNRIGPERRPHAAEWCHAWRRSHRVDYDKAGAGDHFAVIGAAPGHPGIGEAHNGKTACIGALNGCLGGPVGRDHARVV